MHVSDYPGYPQNPPGPGYQGQPGGYQGQPGYKALREFVKTKNADGIIKQLEVAGLRGMGGGDFYRRHLGGDSALLDGVVYAGIGAKLGLSVCHSALARAAGALRR